MFGQVRDSKSLSQEEKDAMERRVAASTVNGRIDPDLFFNYYEPKTDKPKQELFIPIESLASSLGDLKLKPPISETQEILQEISRLKSYIKREKVMCPVDMIMVSFNHYIKLNDFYNANQTIAIPRRDEKPEPEVQSTKKSNK